MRHWRLTAPADAAPTLCVGYRIGSRLAVDGEALSLPLQPPIDWVTVTRAVSLPPGAPHTLQGEHPHRAPLPLAWSATAPLPAVTWAATADGPWVRNATPAATWTARCATRRWRWCCSSRRA